MESFESSGEDKRGLQYALQPIHSFKILHEGLTDSLQPTI